MTAKSGPAYRIHTERLVIRCWEPHDAALLKDAVDSSLEHLRPWLPWAHNEPQELEEKVNLIRLFRGKFDLDQDYTYGIFDREENAVVGGTGLHTRVGSDARELGYWIRKSQINKGYTTETAAALTKVAFEIDKMRHTEIRCDAENVRSAAVPKKLGYQHDATLRRRIVGTATEPRDYMVWSMFANEYKKSPCAAAKIEAFNAAGERIL